MLSFTVILRDGPLVSQVSLVAYEKDDKVFVGLLEMLDPKLQIVETLPRVYPVDKDANLNIPYE